jgi:single-stranded-DNA-specific exonuclease
LAASYLKGLEDANRHRQRIEEQIVREIVAELKKDFLAEKKSIVVFNEKWHVGVLGIVAQKLVEMFKKPAIVITKLNDVWKGSGRGVAGIDLFETISSLSPMLLKYGGHRFACGISLSEENLVSFADAFEKNIAYRNDARETREIMCDAEAEFDELTTELMEYMAQLSPFGVGNPRPNISLMPAGIEQLKYGRVKIIDKNKRAWYGYMSAITRTPFRHAL